jgi:predicted nucleic acid-binding protein
LTVIADTSLVVALFDSDDARHAAACEWVQSLDEDLVTTPLAVAEMDHLVMRGGGDAGRQRLWHDLDVGAYNVRWWADALAETLAIARRHPFLGLTDASLVALAGRLRTARIATFDPHFRSVSTPDGEPFVVLPADA